jgi:hypothetical protein
MIHRRPSSSMPRIRCDPKRFRGRRENQTRITAREITGHHVISNHPAPILKTVRFNFDQYEEEDR